MTTPAGAIPLGATRQSGGTYHAQWSIRPGVRINVVIPAGAYADGALALLGPHLVDTVERPHGVPITPTKDL